MNDDLQEALNDTAGDLAQLIPNPDMGLNQDSFLNEIEGAPTGFSDRMVRNLKGLVYLCGLLGALVVTLSLAMVSSVLDKIAAVSANQLLFFILAAIVGFSITVIPI